MTNQPQGCSLTAVQFDQVSDIYAQASTMYNATAQVGAGRANVELRGPKELLRTLLDEMVTRESGCCSHIAFEIDERANGYHVTLQMPDQGSEAIRQAVAAFFPSALIVR